MKKTLLFPSAIALSLVSFDLASQNVVHQPDGSYSYFRKCTHFEVTRPLRELAKEDQMREKAIEKPAGAEPDVRDIPGKSALKNMGKMDITDPVRQMQQGIKPMSSPLVSFDGSPEATGYPMDPTGASGPNNYVQEVNTFYSVYDKTGKTLLATTSLTNIWPGSTNLCDECVMYDKSVDRWFLSELNYDQSQTNPNTILIAVSQSSDPLGSYYAFTFVPDASDFADFPKFSTWSDGYYMTCNCANDEFVVFDRTKILAGDQSAGFIVENYHNVADTADPTFPRNQLGNIVACPMTFNADDVLPPYGSANYLINFYDDNWGGGGVDELVLWKVSTDWNNQTISMVLDNTLPTAAFNSTWPLNGAFNENDQYLYCGVDQPGAPSTLDARPGYLDFQVHYMRFTDHNSVVCCNMVNVGTSNSPLAGVRWYELRQDTTTKVWSIYQQGTYAPNDGVNRWIPSIAMDYYGNIGLAYNVSNATNVYAGIRYTGRLATDNLGEMTYTEGVGVNGKTVFTNDYRWGDYSSTTIDPDGLTFWHTNMYMENPSSEQAVTSRIFSFQIGSATEIAERNKVQPNLMAYQNGNLLNVKGTDLPSGETAFLELFTAEGKRICVKTVGIGTGMFETSIDGTSLAKGVYLLRIGNSNFQKIIKVPVQ